MQRLVAGEPISWGTVRAARESLSFLSGRFGGQQ